MNINELTVITRIKMKKKFKMLLAIMKILIKFKKYDLVLKIYNKIVENPSNYYVAKINGYKI